MRVTQAQKEFSMEYTELLQKRTGVRSYTDAPPTVRERFPLEQAVTVIE